MKTLIRFIHNEEGTTVIEYAAIASIISIAAVGGMAALTSDITALFVSIQNAFQTSVR